MGKLYKIRGVEIYVPSPGEALPAQRIDLAYKTIDDLMATNYGPRPLVRRTEFWLAFTGPEGQYRGSEMYEALHRLVEDVVAANEASGGRKIAAVDLAKLRSAVNLVERLATDRFRVQATQQTRWVNGWPEAPETPVIAAIGAVQDLLGYFAEELYLTGEQATVFMNQVDLPRTALLGPTLAYRPRSVQQMLDKLKRLADLRFQDFFMLQVVPRSTTAIYHVVDFSRAPSVFFRRVGPDIAFRAQIEVRAAEARTVRERRVHVLYPVIVFAPAIFRMLAAIQQATGGRLPVVVPMEDRDTQRATLDAVADAILCEPLVTEIAGRTRFQTGQQFLSPLELALCQLYSSAEYALLGRAVRRREGETDEDVAEAARQRVEVQLTERLFMYATTKTHELKAWRANMEVLWRTVYGIPRVVRSFKPEDVARAAALRPGATPPKWATVAAPFYTKADALAEGEIAMALEILNRDIVSPLMGMEIDVRERSVLRGDYNYIVKWALQRARQLVEMLEEQRTLIGEQRRW